MRTMNKIWLIGHLGHDPRSKLVNGTVLATFSLATTRRIRVDGQGQNPARYEDEVEWHSISAWGKLAERALNSIHKGDPVFVEGTLRVKSYTAQDGQKRIGMEVVADDFYFLSSKRKTENVQEEPEYSEPLEATLSVQ